MHLCERLTDNPRGRNLLALFDEENSIINTEQGLEFTNELDQQDLATLRVAALLGNTFSLDHLLEVSKIKASKLLQLLDKLMEHNILVQKSSKDKRTYSFAKPKLSKSIAESMGKEEKRIYLFKIINYLKKELPDNEEKLLRLSALHMQFENDKDHFFHRKKAADLLAKSHQAENAVNLYKEIIDKLLSKNRAKAENELLIDTILCYAQIAVSFYPPATVLEVIKKAKLQAEPLRNDRENALLELCLGRIEEMQGKSIVAASNHYNKASDLAKRGNDKKLLLKIGKQLALSFFWQGKVKEAIKLYESTVCDIKTPFSKLENAWAYLMLALCYGITGQTQRALDLALTIKNLAEAKKYPKFQGFANVFIALILTEANLVEQAKPYCEKGMEIGEKIGSDFVLWLAKKCMAYAFYSKGDLEKARNYLESAFYHCSKFGRHHNSCGWHFEIIWALHKANYPPIKGYAFISEIDRLMDWPDIYMKGVALRYLALSKKMSGADSKAIEFLLQESERFLKESGARIELAKTWIELARFFIENKEKTPAKKWANLAYRTLTSINSRLFPPELLFLVQKKKEEVRQFEGMSEIRNAAGLLPDIDAYLSQIVRLLADIFRAERLAVILKKNGALTCKFSIAVSRNFSAEEFQQINKSPLGPLISEETKKNHPLILDDLQKNQKLLVQNSHNDLIKSLATIPLHGDGNEILGWIYMDNLLSKGVLSKKNLPFMTAIGTVISLYLQNSALSKQLSGYQDGYSIEPFSSDQVKSGMGPNVIVGRSEGFVNLLRNAKKVAPTDTTVFILGETGSGKEMIAQQIHQMSHRANKIFIAANLSSLPKDLIASELFGYEKGAFTGAEKSKPGRFEMADKGTIFLDEIGDLAMDVQVKILRVLQEGEFERLGGTQTIHSDFRLIVATNKDLHSMVANGDFRADLFYRINAFPITVPPLRDRKEDIPELAVYFMQKYQTKNRKNFQRITNNEMQKLLEYSWPGNIRELEHIIERAVVLSDNDTLIIPDLELPCNHFTEGNFSQEKLLPLNEIERRHILNVLNQVRWRISGERGAAKILGLKPTTLDFRIKKLGITKLTN